MRDYKFRSLQDAADFLRMVGFEISADNPGTVYPVSVYPVFLRDVEWGRGHPVVGYISGDGSLHLSLTEEKIIAKYHKKLVFLGCAQIFASGKFNSKNFEEHGLCGSLRAIEPAHPNSRQLTKITDSRERELRIARYVSPTRVRSSHPRPGKSR